MEKLIWVSKLGICSLLTVSATLKIQTPTTSTEVIPVTFIPTR